MQPEALTLRALFPLSPADFPTVKVESVIEALRSALSCRPAVITVADPPPPVAADVSASHKAEIEELHSTIASLHEELGPSI
jgi:hypothetical protein